MELNRHTLEFLARFPHLFCDSQRWDRIKVDDRTAIFSDLSKGISILHIIKVKYQMTEKIEVMINCWIRGLVEMPENCFTFQDVITHLVDLRKRFNTNIRGYLTKNNNIAPWFCLFHKNMERTIQSIGEILNSEGSSKYEGIDWDKNNPKGNLTDPDTSFKPNKEFLKQLGEIDIQYCVICKEGICGYSSQDYDTNGRKDPAFYPCSKMSYNGVEYLCSIQCGMIKDCKETAAIRDMGCIREAAKTTWNICQVCYKYTRLFKCGGCRSTKYCSKQCQHEHWFQHKEICFKIRKKKEKKTQEK